MIIKQTKAHRRNMIILAILSVICLFAPLYFLGESKEKLVVYSLIFLPFSLLFAFISLLMRLSLNNRIEISRDGLLLNARLKQPVPWSKLQSARIHYLHMPRSRTIPFLTIVFRYAHTDKKPNGLDRKTFKAGEELSMSGIDMMTYQPEEIAELISTQIDNAESRSHPPEPA